MSLKQIDLDSVDWIDLIQNRDRWRAVVNTVMNLQIHKMLDISWLDEELSFTIRTLLHGVGELGS